MQEAVLPPDPLQTVPPSFPARRAIEVAERLFGVTGNVSALDSERDQNLRLDSGARSFLLKFSNPADDAAVLQMQAEAMLHIARVEPRLPVMQPLPAASGGYLATVEDDRGVGHVVRLFTFLPGSMLRSSELGLDAIERCGEVVARMGVALRGFFHPAAGYPILWDLKNTPGLRPLVSALPRGRRASVVRVLDRFDERVAALLPALRAQLVHNDLTLDNVLLDDSHRVSGIVDFGDLTHTAAICDLAVCLVSMMWGRDDPIEAASVAVHGYESVTELEGAEAAVLADLVRARLAALVTIAAWRMQRYPDNAAYITSNTDLAWDLLERLGDDDIDLAAVRSGRAELIERRAHVLGPALSPLTYDEPLYLVRGEGYLVYDEGGRAYVDAYNNVPVVGHGNPAVARAIGRQSATLNTNTRYLHEAVVELAERLTGTMPEDLDTVMFVNSGSEANDVAWRLATAYTGASGAIVTARAYHGVTTATLALSPEEWVAGNHPEHVATVPAPDPYRGPHRLEEDDWPGRYASHLSAAIQALGGRGYELAAFYVDSLFTSDGIFTPPPGYLREVARIVHGAGGLVVADEVQSGYGRTGSHLWSFARAGITPDFVTLGKPMGNGHPVAAVVTRREIAARFADKTDLFSTFGGNPVAARAALAVLDELQRLDLQANAASTGAYLFAELQRLGDQHRSIGEVRGAGLMIGVELVADRDTREPDAALAHRVMNAMKDAGVLVGLTGPDDNVLKVRPPLVLDKAGAALIVTALDTALRGP